MCVKPSSRHDHATTIYITSLDYLSTNNLRRTEATPNASHILVIPGTISVEECSDFKGYFPFAFLLEHRMTFCTTRSTLHFNEVPVRDTIHDIALQRIHPSNPSSTTVNKRHFSALQQQTIPQSIQPRVLSITPIKPKKKPVRPIMSR